ncbi:hypothetical protein FPRO03_09139 [Fusarium proliferatum]|nr:hypothetical protein FPRO03_09139 [Fusarium proliferatum]
MIHELHDDLQRKWKAHGPQVETAWRPFNKAQRAKCMRAGSADGLVLKHSSDVSLGNVYKFIPEWNLEDITAPNSDFLLDILKHRSTKILFEQYAEGVSGTLGDRHLIEKMVREKNLHHVDPFKHSYTYFYDEKYGQRARPSAAITILQLLNVMIEDILDQGSQTRARGGKKKQSKNTPLSESASKQATVKPTTQEIVSIASDQKSSLEEYLSLLRTEPTVLCPGVNVQYFSRPELVPDEKGLSLPVHTDKYIGPAVFETIHHAVQGIAVWESITGLLDLLEKPFTDKLYESTILQELANICHFEQCQGLDERQAGRAYAITPTTDSLEHKEATKTAQPVKVSSSTAGVFATLFNKTESRGSVNWSSFEAAMSELGFSVLPRFGSVYTFRPSEDMDIKRPVSIYRPHQSQIEGYLILILARRLNRAYGWSEDSFVTE